jgi:hypothetical protein
MTGELARLVPPVALEDPADPYWIDTKATDQLLDRLFAGFFTRLGLENLMRKTNYHVLARHVAEPDIDPEVREVLDQIAGVAACSTASALPDETRSSPGASVDSQA